MGRDESIGPAQVSVWEGELLYSSPSSITKYDPGSYGGCPARWHFDKVQGLEEADTAATMTGKAEHGQIETYLLGGEKALSRIVMAAAQFIPEPGDGLMIEQGIASTQMTLAGVRIVGYQDVVNLRGEYIDTVGVLRKENEPGTFESLDWKTTGNMANAKNGPQLAATPQMTVYAESLFRDFGARFARLSHVCMKTKGAPDAQKSTIVVTPEENAPRVARLEGLIRSMRDTAREPDVAKVEKNHSSCNAYNKTCDYAARCPRSAADKLISILGGQAKKGPSDVSNLKNLLRMKSGVTTPPANETPAPAAPAAPPPPLDDAPPKDPLLRKAWLQAQLDKEEQAAKAPPSLKLFDPREVERLPSGTQVQLYGAAAAAYAGPNVKTVATGLGQLAKLGFGIAETTEQATIKATDPYRKVPPSDVPESDPVKAALPVPAETIPTLPPVVQEAAKAHAELAAGTPAPVTGQEEEDEEPALEEEQESAPAQAEPTPTLAPERLTELATAAGVTVPELSQVQKLESPPAAEKPKRGRPAKPKDEPAQAPPASQAAPTTSVINYTVFVDAQLLEAPGPVAGGDLDGYVQAKCDQLAAAHGVFDIRAASEGPLAFSRWKGYLDALIKAEPPSPGVYTYQTFGDELRTIAANALRQVVRTMGGVYVRGRA
jgi:hypothetical protein